MDIRQLNYFISVAEHLNFTRAAEHHFIAQTAISQQILTLEQQLGVKLFLRNNRSVELTPAGKVLYKEAKLIVAKAEEAVKKTQKAASGAEGTLKIGFLGTNEKTFFPQLIRRFHYAFPSIDLTLVQDNAEALRERLKHGRLDIIFNPGYGITKDTDFETKSVFKDPICVIVYRNHPLAGRPHVSLADLSSDTIIFVDRSEVPDGYDSFIHTFAKQNISPKVICPTRTFDTILLLVEAELGITLLPRCFEMYKNENLCFIDLEEEESFELVAAWEKDNLNQSIPLFLSLLDTI